MELDQTLHQLYLVTNYVVTMRVTRVVTFQKVEPTNGTNYQTGASLGFQPNQGKNTKFEPDVKIVSYIHTL